MEYGIFCFLFSYFILLYVLTRCYKCFLCMYMRLRSDFEVEFTSISPENSLMEDLGGNAVGRCGEKRIFKLYCRSKYTLSKLISPFKLVYIQFMSDQSWCKQVFES